MFIYDMVYKRFVRAAKSKLAYTTDDDRFWLIKVEIKLLQKLPCRLGRSNGWISHDDRVVERRSDVQCLAQQATSRGAHCWHVTTKRGTC
jgi:hypothetical protein